MTEDYNIPPMLRWLPALAWAVVFTLYAGMTMYLADTTSRRPDATWSSWCYVLALGAVAVCSAVVIARAWKDARSVPVIIGQAAPVDDGEWAAHPGRADPQADQQPGPSDQPLPPLPLVPPVPRVPASQYSSGGGDDREVHRTPNDLGRADDLLGQHALSAELPDLPELASHAALVAQGTRVQPARIASDDSAQDEWAATEAFPATAPDALTSVAEGKETQGGASEGRTSEGRAPEPEPTGNQRESAAPASSAVALVLPLRQRLGDMLRALEAAGILDAGEVPLDIAVAATEGFSDREDFGLDELLAMLQTVEAERGIRYRHLALYPTQGEVSDRQIAELVEDVTHLVGRFGDLGSIQLESTDDDVPRETSAEGSTPENAIVHFDLDGCWYSVPFRMFAQGFPLDLIEGLAGALCPDGAERIFVEAWSDGLVAISCISPDQLAALDEALAWDGETFGKVDAVPVAAPAAEFPPESAPAELERRAG